MYKIVVSGVPFSLSEASIRSDSPDTNLLAMSLLGDFAEAQDQTLTLDRNATSFKLVKDHLTGYTIFPLDATDCGGIAPERMLRYLLDDSEYYGLQNLQNAVRAERAKLVKKQRGNRVHTEVALVEARVAVAKAVIDERVRVIDKFLAWRETDQGSTLGGYGTLDNSWRKLEASVDVLASVMAYMPDEDE